MSKVLENRKSMFEGVKTVLERALDKLGKIPALLEAANSFSTLVGQIDDLSPEVDKATAGKTQTKSEAQENLIVAMLPVTSSLTALANKTNDAELKAKVDLSYWELKHQRDTDLKKKAKLVLETATDKLAVSTDFGVTQARLDNITAMSTAYDKAMGDKQASPSARAAASEELLKLYTAAGKLLTDQIDHLMETLSEDEPKLAEEYANARVIRNVGLRHKPPAPPSQQAAPQSK